MASNSTRRWMVDVLASAIEYAETKDKRVLISLPSDIRSLIADVFGITDLD